MNTLDLGTQERIKQWLSTEYDAETQNHIKKLLDEKQSDELTDAFYKDLEFGTGGLRGVMGVGSNRINKYTVGKATQGLSNYLKQSFPNEELKVAVCYDSRNNSKSYAELVASIFSANSIKVYLFDALRPTPMLSFAIRHYGCHSGVMLTASHNPKEYNGYKAYWSNGGQLVPPHDNGVIKNVNAIQSVTEIKFDRNNENIISIGKDFDDIYIQKNKDLSISPEIITKQKDLKIVYSAIHGTGITVIPQTLKSWGFTNVHLVEEQSEPSGDFPTVVYPNPEEEEAMSLAKKKGEEIKADLILATDPDTDRVGAAAKNHNGAYQLLNGNQIAVLLVYYVLSVKNKNSELKSSDYIVKTIVTSQLAADIAKNYGVECFDTLTGFKYIGELMTELENARKYLAGGEESYGYLVGDLVRDKDAVNACAFIAEMTAYFKNKGQSLFDVLLDLYKTYGVYHEKLVSITKKGKKGADEIKAIMDRLRNDSPKTLGGVTLKEIRDYDSSTAYHLADNTTSVINLPQSNVLQFISNDGDIISVRPSGTEPKIKFYCSVKGSISDTKEYDTVRSELDKKVDEIMSDIINTES